VVWDSHWVKHPYCWRPSDLVSITGLLRTVDSSHSDMGLPVFDIFSKCLPKGGKSLTMATPVRVELDKPEGLGVVEGAGVGVVEVDHNRIRIQSH